VTGSKVAAEAGTLIFIVGGNASTIERVHPCSAPWQAVIHMGENGLGLAAKLAQNLTSLSSMQVCVKDHAAKKMGRKPEKMFELIQAS